MYPSLGYQGCTCGEGFLETSDTPQALQNVALSVEVSNPKPQLPKMSRSIVVSIIILQLTALLGLPEVSLHFGRSFEAMEL